MPILNARLKTYMSAKCREAAAAATERQARLAALRARILERAVAKSRLAPGLFTLTVPTGGGKTLASLSFALEHAVAHGLRRVVYVIPFTSIIEQTARAFRAALGEPGGDPNDCDVIEHHASFDWDKAFETAHERGAGTSMVERMQSATENWDAPVVVTTAVQFVEVEHRREPISDEAIAARFAEQSSMLCIVNSRRHAKALFGCIADLLGAVHLSTWMCPRHRRLVLESARVGRQDCRR